MTERWTNGPGATYPGHAHPYDKRLVVERGSITFHLTRDGRDVLLRASERLELPAGTPHAATVGPDGVTCVETHSPPFTAVE
ncbi:MAG: cupin [Candidatus Omnitrophica bacterium]|nr:cupin [Candidatus Omnitrophota bacterium]